MKVEFNLNFNAMMVTSMLILVLAMAGVVSIVIHRNHCSQCQQITTSKEVIGPNGQSNK